MRSVLSLGAFVAVALSIAAAEDVSETYPDGKTVKLKFTKNANGEKDGPFTEFYPNGKARAKGTYKAGKLDGKLTHYYPNGVTLSTATYKGGAKDGEYKDFTSRGGLVTTATFKEGELTGNLRLMAQSGNAGFNHPIKKDGPVIPRFPGDVAAALMTVATLPTAVPKGDSLANERLTALRRLQQYRAVVGVPFEGMSLDDDYNTKTQAGAKLLEKIGKLDHKPPQPKDYPEDEYKLGYEGTSHSNIYTGQTILANTLDGYMDDSDKTNIERVGHRRWCINPAMLKTGFGRSGKYSAMWSFDSSRKDIPDYEFVAYPAAGFFPAEYFGERHAWSIQFHPKKYAKLDANVKAKVSVLTDKLGPPLKLDFHQFNNDGMGIPNCLIFRPEKAGLAPGKRYVVEVEGLKKLDGKAATISYLVVFVNLG